MKDTIVTQATYALGFGNMPFEAPTTLPSQTVPGMTMSLRQLVERYTRGEPVPAFTPVFVGDDDVIPDNLERMDVQDKLMLSKDLADAIQTERSRRSSPSRGSDPVSPLVPDIAPHSDASVM